MMKWRLIILLLATTSAFAQSGVGGGGQTNVSGGGSSGPITPATVTVTTAGVFTNTQYNGPSITANLNGCNPSVEYSILQVGQQGTDAVVGCVTVPVGSTVHQADAIAGYVSTASTNTFPVALYGAARCLVTNCSIWGANPVAADGGFAANIMYGIENDLNITNAGSKGFGARAIGAWTAQPGQSKSGPGNVIGFSVGAPISGTNKWTSGFNCDTAATDNSSGNGNCLDIGSIATGADKASQAITWHSTTSTSTVMSNQFFTSVDGNDKPDFIFIPNSAFNTNGVFAAMLPVPGASSGISPSNMLSAGSTTLVAGTKTVTFTQAYAVAPKCVANGQTIANAMLAIATTTQITVTSSSGADTQVVSWLCMPAAN